MKQNHVYLLLLTVMLAAVFLSCLPTHPEPDVQIYTFPPGGSQPDTGPLPGNPLAAPSPGKPEKEYIESNVLVDERNNIFSIGIPPGYREKTEVIAQKPIDFWFEYQITNATGKDISYNLHLVPSAAAESVPVLVRQRWIP